MRSVELKAPAKINLFLRVVGKRSDGYHQLESLMVPIALFDTVHIRRLPAGIEVRCPARPDLDGPDNLAHRAAQAWLQRAREPLFGVSIAIEKQIPVQAGLGGGSSDAAATLRGLQRLSTNRLPNGAIEEIATTLGADVPFFLQDAPCLARGIGERLSPLSGLPGFWLLLAQAPFGLETRRVYENLKYPLTSASEGASDENPDWGFDQLAAGLVNDLQPIGESLHPEIGRVRRELLLAGAVGALMSGSGPSVFGMFPTPDAAHQALWRLRQVQGWTYLVLRAII